MNNTIRSLLACTMLQAWVPAFTQNLFDLGFKGGLNRDDLATDYHHEGLLGGNIGLFARVKAPVFPGIQGEVLLSSLGAHARVEGYEADVRTVSLQVPLFAVLAFGPVELHGGGYYEHYLTKSFITDLDVQIEGQEIELADLADDGFGVLVGAGVRFRHFYAGLRYNMGMTPMGSAPFLDNVYSRQLQAYIGLGLFKPFD